MSESPKNAGPLRPGKLLPPRDKLRPAVLLRTSRLHAHRCHSGAPWHEDYADLTDAETKKKLPYRTKSVFDSFTLIDDAIERANSHDAIVGMNGNLIIIVNFPYEVGFVFLKDPGTNTLRDRRTDIATVIVDPKTGEVITVFPGRPSNEAMPLPFA